MIANEKKLIKKAKTGNQQAFKKLYDHYADYALRSAFAITRNRNHAADIVQETFIKVYRHLHQFNVSKSFKPWFYRILLNECKRYMKKQNKQAFTVDDEELLDYLQDERTERDQYEEVKSALEELNEMHRTVLVLKYLNGFTEKEIADLLELNVNTVKSRLFIGRKKLRELLGGEDNER